MSLEQIHRDICKITGGICLAIITRRGTLSQLRYYVSQLRYCAGKLEEFVIAMEKKKKRSAEPGRDRQTETVSTTEDVPPLQGRIRGQRPAAGNS